MGSAASTSSCRPAFGPPESKPGQGSSFYVFFPSAVEGDSTLAEGFALIPSGAERVLLVGDMEELFGEGGFDLEQLGYSVAFRPDGAEALETLKTCASEFDLVIANQKMADMEGTEFTEAFLDLRPGIPIILCTGSDETISGEEARSRGVCEIISKPVSLRELAKSIRKALA